MTNQSALYQNYPKINVNPSPSLQSHCRVSQKSAPWISLLFTTQKPQQEEEYYNFNYLSNTIHLNPSYFFLSTSIHSKSFIFSNSSYFFFFLAFIFHHLLCGSWKILCDKIHLHLYTFRFLSNVNSSLTV